MHWDNFNRNVNSAVVHILIKFKSLIKFENFHMKHFKDKFPSDFNNFFIFHQTVSVSMKNYLRAMKRVLYDIGPLTIVRWSLYRALKVWHTHRTKIQAEKGPPTQKLEKNKCVLKWSLGKIQCFKPMFFLFLFFFLVENQVLTPPPP